MLQSVLAIAQARPRHSEGARPRRTQHEQREQPRHRRHLALAGAVLGLLACPTRACAQSAGEWRDAQHLYASSCTFCHDTGVGPNLRGVGWPKEYVAVRVRMGYQAMPAFKPSEISAADIEALAAWLAEQPLPPGVARAGAEQP